MSGVKEKVTILENKPANKTHKKFDSIKYKLIWIIVGGIAVYLLGQILSIISWWEVLVCIRYYY